jgi:hypothetical protein
MHRVRYLDGLRNIAAMVVGLQQYLLAFCPSSCAAMLRGAVCGLEACADNHATPR